jgi:hypothetical protein
MQGGQAHPPYIWEAADYLNRVIRITVNFDDGTRLLSGATVFRDAGCVYTKILVGKGVDGSPDSTTKSFTVPAGTTPISQAQMNSRGFDTIEDFLALQITAGR